MTLAQKGDIYCPLNPANGECGGVDAASGHGHEADSLFYCDMSAANREIVESLNGACQVFSEVDSRYPVVVAATGDGRPIVFFASKDRSNGGRDRETVYVICEKPDCSETSVPLQLEGFNAQFALDFTYVHVDGKKLLTLTGVGSQTSSDIGFAADGYPLHYAYCVDDECSSFVSTSLGDRVETAGDTKNVQRLVSLERYSTAEGDRLAMLYFPGRGRAGNYQNFTNAFPDPDDFSKFASSDGLLVAGESRDVQFGVFNGDFNPNFERRRDMHEGAASSQQRKVSSDADEQSDPNSFVTAASLSNDAYYVGNMFTREYAVLASCHDPPRCTEVSQTHVQAQSSRVLSPYRAARPWTRDSAWTPVDLGAVLDEELGMSDYGTGPQNMWTPPYAGLWDEPFVAKTHAAVPHLVSTDQGLWVGFQVNHYQGLTDIDDGITRIGRMRSTSQEVADGLNDDTLMDVPALQYQALHMCLDVQLISNQLSRSMSSVQGTPHSDDDDDNVLLSTFLDKIYLADHDTPLSTLLQRHEATPWANSATLKWVSCGADGRQCTMQSGYYTTINELGRIEDDDGPFGGVTNMGTLSSNTPPAAWMNYGSQEGNNPAYTYTESERRKRGSIVEDGLNQATGSVTTFSLNDFMSQNHGMISPPGVEVPDPNMGWRFQARRRTGAGASALQSLPFDATELTLTNFNTPNTDPGHRYGTQLSESVAEESSEASSELGKRSDDFGKRGAIQDDIEDAREGSPNFWDQLGLGGASHSNAYRSGNARRSCTELLGRLRDSVTVSRDFSNLLLSDVSDESSRNNSAVHQAPYNPFMPSGYHGALWSQETEARQHAAWLTGLHSGEQAPSVFATGAAGNGFPASVGVVSGDTGEPSAAGWAIVLSVCVTPSCDQQIYRYLMDSSTLHDNWGLLDDPLTSNNEILNHPDGSWTIVIFVRPHGEGSTRERKQQADGRSGSTLYREGSSGKPLFINCLDETCSEASISTLAPNRLQSVLPVDVVADWAQPTGTLLLEQQGRSEDESFRFPEANSAVSIRLQAHQVHSYAYTGANHERLLVAVRDISLCSGANMDPSAEWDNCNENGEQLVPPVRFWSTNRYASPTGEPCSRHSVGSVAVADDSVFVCTRLSTGHDLSLGGISGWVRYYEWVDVANSFSARLFANIPAGPSPVSTSLNSYPGDLWNSKSRTFIDRTP